MNNICHYFVEGECEEKMINLFKLPQHGSILLSGKVDVFNFINKEISNPRITRLKKGTIIILVYDTDVKNTEVLDKNIQKLNRNGFKKIFHVHSVKNFEDEIIFSSDLKNINHFFQTDSPSEFKTRFLHANGSSLLKKFDAIHLDMDKFWARMDNDVFQKYASSSGSRLIKQK